MAILGVELSLVVVVSLGIAAVAILGGFALLVSSLFGSKDDTDIRAVQSDPVIGYKYASLPVLDWDGKKITGIRFCGVTGTHYDADDEKSGYSGFHMFNDMHQAVNHPQRGSVLLEVIGYGDIKHFSEGTETSHQRVLQVILDECIYCHSSATGILLDDYEEAEPVCKRDSRWSRRTYLPLSKLSKQTWEVADDVHIGFAPLRDLPRVKAYVPTPASSLVPSTQKEAQDL